MAKKNNNNDAELAFTICAPLIVIAIFSFVMLMFSVGIVKCFMFLFSLALMALIIKSNKNKTKGIIIGLIAFICFLFINFAIVVPNMQKESQENSSSGSLNNALSQLFFGSKDD